MCFEIFIPDHESRVLDPDFFSSRIPDLGSGSLISGVKKGLDPGSKTVKTPYHSLPSFISIDTPPTVCCVAFFILHLRWAEKNVNILIEWHNWWFSILRIFGYGFWRLFSDWCRPWCRIRRPTSSTSRTSIPRTNFRPSSRRSSNMWCIQLFLN